MKAYIPPADLTKMVKLKDVENLFEKILIMDRTLQAKPEDRFVWGWKDINHEYVTTLMYDEWKEWDVEKRSQFVRAIASIGHTAGIT